MSHYTFWNKNHCGTGDAYLTGCLNDVKDWLDSNTSWKDPITVWIDTKGASTDWTSGSHNDTSMVVKETLGSRVITPAELKSWVNTQDDGNSKTLRQGVADYGWPNLNQLDNDTSTGSVTDYGDIIVILTGNTNSLDSYANHYSGKSTDQMFVCPRVDYEDDFKRDENPSGFSSAEAAWVVCGNFQWGDHRQELMNQSYSDNYISHVWENSGSGYAELSQFAYSYIAISHGAQFLSRARKVDTFNDHVPLVSVRRSTPGYFSLKNKYGEKCLDVSGEGGGNGTDVVLWDCDGGDNQHFVYTMESQLRPRHATTKCVDVSGGNASGQWHNIHIWDCDGGESEKWKLQDIKPYFLNHEDTDYGMGTGGSSAGTSGSSLQTRNLDALDWAGQWDLVTDEDWPNDVKW